MAISFVAAGATSTGATLTLAVPTGYASGDIFFIVCASASATVTTPTGWSVLTGTSINPLYVYYKIATASESSVVLATGNTSSAGVMVGYRSATGIDATGTRTTATTTTPATTSFNTTTANDFVISLYVCNSSGSTTWTAPASTTTRVNLSPGSTSRGILVVDELQASAGATTVRTATITNSLSTTTIATSISSSVTANTSSFFFMFR